WLIKFIFQNLFWPPHFVCRFRLTHLLLQQSNGVELPVILGLIILLPIAIRNYEDTVYPTFFSGLFVIATIFQQRDRTIRGAGTKGDYHSRYLGCATCLWENRCRCGVW